MYIFTFTYIYIYTYNIDAYCAVLGGIRKLVFEAPRSLPGARAEAAAASADPGEAMGLLPWRPMGDPLKQRSCEREHSHVTGQNMQNVIGLDFNKFT